MTESATLALAPQAAEVHGLTADHWRQLLRLCRWIEREDPDARTLLGPRALPCAQALRRAQAVWKRRRSEPQRREPPPLRALVALAAAAQGLAQRVRERPAKFFAPAKSSIGQGVLLRMPALKAWLQQSFPLEAAVPPGAPPELAIARAREVLVQQCLDLCETDDTFERRRHLMHLLEEHGHSEPMLRLVRRAGRGWLPKGWAEGWVPITGVGDDKKAIDALDAAMAASTSALDAWAQEPKPVVPPSQPAASGTAAPAASKRRAGLAGATPIILRAMQVPRRVLWLAAGVAVLAVVVGLVLHLTGGSGAARSRWVTYYEADGATMSIDPASIRREGRRLTYRVGVVWARDRASAVAVFTTDCVTHQRRLETVQHYSGTRFETATRYEVRGTSAGQWPPTGVDVALLRAACAQS